MREDIGRSRSPMRTPLPSRKGPAMTLHRVQDRRAVGPIETQGLGQSVQDLGRDARSRLIMGLSRLILGGTPDIVQQRRGIDHIPMQAAAPLEIENPGDAGDIEQMGQPMTAKNPIGLRGFDPRQTAGEQLTLSNRGYAFHVRLQTSTLVSMLYPIRRARHGRDGKTARTQRKVFCQC